MKIIENTLENIIINYPIETIANKEDILFLDIETTGFTAKTSNLYLIGCVYYKDGNFKTIQYFGEKYTDEEEILKEFFAFLENFKYIIHFNGNNFDIPYILSKCKAFNLSFNLDNVSGIDLYKRIAPYKRFLKLENCKQKTVESFLNIKRDDKYSGGDLIGIYHEYVKNNDKELEDLLLLHNFDDIKGMLKILPSLAYSDLFTKKLTVTKVSANYYNDEEGRPLAELLMVIDLPAPLITPVSFLYDKCYFACGGSQALIKVPLYEEELKYFYANYKDYYYLPKEDIALHKSVSSFVDKEFREKATKETCYTRHFAKYLPEWEPIINPFFKRDYNSTTLFFELTEERRQDRELFSKYASHILNHMAI